MIWYIFRPDTKTYIDGWTCMLYTFIENENGGYDMGRKKLDPSQNGESTVIAVDFAKNGSCDNKLFYAERIKHFREKAQLTPGELAKAVHVGPSAISNWEAGRTRPDITNLPLLCEVLHITVSEFFSDEGIGSEFSSDERNLLYMYRSFKDMNRKLLLNMAMKMAELENAEHQAELNTNLIELYYAEDTVAAGIAFSGFEGKSKPVYVYNNANSRRADIVFRVNGDSMEPEYPNKSIVLVEFTKGSLLPGDVGIFQVDGDLFIKEYRKDGLHSFNPQYSPMTHDEYEDIKVIGRVVGKLDNGDFATEEEITAFRAKN